MQTLNTEQLAIQKIERLLTGNQTVSLQAEGEGEAIALPATVVQILKQAVAHIAQGRTVFIVPASPMITTGEAADLLKISRTELTQLLDEGKIPFTHIRNRRHILVNDLLTYQKQRQQAPKPPASAQN